MAANKMPFTVELLHTVEILPRSGSYEEIGGKAGAYKRVDGAAAARSVTISILRIRFLYHSMAL
jgi:hypothetical protein